MFTVYELDLKSLVSILNNSELNECDIVFLYEMFSCSLFSRNQTSLFDVIRKTLTEPLTEQKKHLLLSNEWPGRGVVQNVKTFGLSN